MNATPITIDFYFRVVSLNTCCFMFSEYGAYIAPINAKSYNLDEFLKEQ